MLSLIKRVQIYTLNSYYQYNEVDLNQNLSVKFVKKCLPACGK
ncbi:MAG: hypothetical protein EZS26_000702 [Candidatus Ordinivivax streblomastigis]|jgi:hypothetical protein|uniref:Uncharacterized protein n=1 Tax=Candidatus Ordinivivax streblomastigis TaxID=2540710 RepID=A0A5M8P3P4_9BACT|nr:MAG: hypothetical protein EZS26_000702 [Candidatus Ordinivivax streblomastigis]